MLLLFWKTFTDWQLFLYIKWRFYLLYPTTLICFQIAELHFLLNLNYILIKYTYIRVHCDKFIVICKMLFFNIPYFSLFVSLHVLYKQIFSNLPWFILKASLYRTWLHKHVLSYTSTTMISNKILIFCFLLLVICMLCCSILQCRDKYP